MGAKFKFMTHLLNTFFDFWRRFFACLTSKFEKSTNVRHMTGTGSGLLGGIPRVVVQMSALTLKGPL